MLDEATGGPQYREVRDNYLDWVKENREAFPALAEVADNLELAASVSSVGASGKPCPTVPRDAMGRFTPRGGSRSPSFDTEKARRIWEKANNRNWPRDPRTGKPFDVHHPTRRVDGGVPYDPRNITPVHPDKHPRIHAKDGPSPNWPP
jgi:hypothetical protein